MKAIVWPGRFRRLARSDYTMFANVGRSPVFVTVTKVFYNRWLFSVAVGDDGHTEQLSGYAHTMAAAKRCAHRDMQFLIQRTKGAL